jgi:hypothetical protein
MKLLGISRGPALVTRLFYIPGPGARQRRSGFFEAAVVQEFLSSARIRNRRLPKEISPLLVNQNEYYNRDDETAKYCAAPSSFEHCKKSSKAGLAITMSL